MRGAAALAGALLALAALSREPPPRKLLIEWGWGEPDTAFLRAHVREMERAPFDGVVFHALYRGAAGTGNLAWRFLGPDRVERGDLDAAREDLQRTPFRSFTANFLRLNLTPGLDWYDDFAAVVAKARIAAELARDGRARGILLDTEAYERPVFHYASQREAATRSFAEYAAQVRGRGRAMMEAFESGYPGLTVLLSFGHTLPWYWMRKDGVPLEETRYGLLPAFVDGLLDGARDAIVVDGHELSYWYKDEHRFADAYRAMSQDVLPIVGDPERYRRRMSFGFGLWMDWDWRNLGWHPDEPARNYFTPAALERSVAAALRHADEFVWVYSETPRWWSAAGGRVKLPDAYDRALRHAHALAREPARRPPRGSRRAAAP
jgi:hypothetical protein